MRNVRILLLWGLMAPLSVLPVATGAAPRPSTQVSAEDDELDFAVQQTAHAYHSQLEVLRSMQDAVSTANAVPRLKKLMCMRYKLYGMGFHDAAYCERCDAAVHEDALACAQELRRLEAASFFGVEPARALFFEQDATMKACVGETLLAAARLDADVLEEVAERFRLDMAHYQQEHAWLVGGPGFSRESAWVIAQEDSAMARERHFLREVLHTSPCGQSLHEVDGRMYDCLYTVLTINGEPYRIEQWFDVTHHHSIGVQDEEQVAEDLEPGPDPLPAPAPPSEEDDELIAEDPDLDE